MLGFRVQCVHCGANLSSVEHNTEHILDLNMGGLNTLENKTLICKKCNQARSRLKQELFGNTPEITMWNFIEKYILWSFITLDYGHRAGMWLPEIHMTFLKFANNGREFEQSGIRYFARASDNRPTVLDQGGTPSAGVQKPKTPSTIQPPLLTRLSQGIGRWLKGSDHDHLNRSNPQQPPTLNPTNSEPERGTATKAPPKQRKHSPVNNGSPKQEPTNLESQRKALAKVIKMVFTEAMTASTLSTRIMKQWSKDHGTRFKSWKELVNHFEFDTSKDLGTIIRTLLGAKSVSSKKGPSGEFLLVPKVGKKPNGFPEVDPEFQRHVLKALENNDSEVLLGAVSPILSKYLESIGLEGQSFKQFAKSYGIPLRRTAVEIVAHYFDGSLGYRREGKTVVYIWLVK